MPVFFRAPSIRRRRRQWLPPSFAATEGAGLAAGQAAVTGAIEAVKDFVGTSDGVATATAAGQTVADRAGLSEGIGTVAGVIEALTGVDHSAAGAAVGVATAAASGQAATTLTRPFSDDGVDLVREDGVTVEAVLPLIVTGALPPIGNSTELFR